MAKNKNKGKPRNYELDSGVVRYVRCAICRLSIINSYLPKLASKHGPTSHALSVLVIFIGQDICDLVLLSVPKDRIYLSNF